MRGVLASHAYYIAFSDKGANLSTGAIFSAVRDIKQSNDSTTVNNLKTPLNNPAQKSPN
jgi:hypothetical protein